LLLFCNNVSQAIKLKYDRMSGAGTNSGINYQQRIAALTLVAQYTDFDLAGTFGIGQKLEIDSVHFETDDPIDDLKIKCKDCILFLQIKRSLSFQIDFGTDFYKTIEQFITQFIKKSFAQEHYVLATTSNSSGSITQELNKITESIRLNDDAFIDNPLNKSEKETFDKFKNLFHSIYKIKSGKDSKPKDFINFSKQIYIAIIDIELGRPNEQVAIFLLSGKRFIDPVLVWNTLIANCLEYARKRQSVSKQSIEKILKRYIPCDEDTSNESDELKAYFNTEIIQHGRIPVAKEVLFIESFIDGVDYLITELFRFSDDGKIKHEFKRNLIKLADTNDEWVVLQRAATIEGIERFISDNSETFKNKKIAFLPSNPDYNIESDENKPIAELHRSYLQELARKNTDFIKCLHCDKTIAVSSGCFVVEIDDVDSKPAIGAVHNTCKRPIDRIIGRVIPNFSVKDFFLKTFDFKTWARLMMKGQGLMNGYRSSKGIQNREPIVAWSAIGNEFNDYSYCLNFLLSNGATIFMTDRGKIHRFNKPDAEKAKEEILEGIVKYREINNPLSYTSKKFCYGNREQLLKIKDADETVIEIENIEVTRYSKLLEKREEHIFFYAPICIVRNIEDETILNLGNIVPLISDPLSFENIYKSWNLIDSDKLLQQLELKIIKSDTEFDSYMREFFGTGIAPIIDPYLNENGELVKGVRLIHREQMLAEHENFRNPVDNPKWLKGDKVELMIPTIEDNNYPKGVIIEDEFKGKDNQLYVIFRPIEDGEAMEDLAYTVPSRLLSKSQ